MSNALAGDGNAALGRWANRLCLVWGGSDPSVRKAALIGRKGEFIGEVWRSPGGSGWRWEIADKYGGRDGLADSASVARDLLLAHALLDVFLTNLEGWKLELHANGTAWLNYDVALSASRYPVNVFRLQKVGAASAGMWQVDAMTNASAPGAERYVNLSFHDYVDALVLAVDRAMIIADQLGLVPGDEKPLPEPKPDDGEIDQEQLGRTREALDGF